jgi:ATP-dependent Lon protease
MTATLKLPTIVTGETITFPGTTLSLTLTGERQIKAAEAAAGGERVMLLVPVRRGVEFDPKAAPVPRDLGRIGVIGTFLKGVRRERTLEIAIQLDRRAQVTGWVEGEYLEAVALPLEDRIDSGIEFEALFREVKDSAVRVAELRGLDAAVARQFLDALPGAGAVADLVAARLDLDEADARKLLETTVVAERFRLLLTILERETGILETQRRIEEKVHEEVGKNQREFFLREQLKAIQRELGESGEGGPEDDLERRIALLQLPEKVAREVERELQRLKTMGGHAPDAQVLRNWLSWISELPWNARSDEKIDLDEAARILDADHYGLAEVKERVIEYLAVRALRLERQARGELTEAEVRKSPILLFVGPPGVGKTSIAKAIAQATGREYVRISLGGSRDESDIRGHRRTYVGALPGRIVQGLKTAGTKNPVFVLDEVDKLGVSFQGDPSSALLEVLDPAQNDSFVDHYLGVPFDLSEILFVATANYADRIPGPLMDRMEVVRFSGYTEAERVEIGRRYLWPRQVRESGIRDSEVDLGDDALRVVVSNYTREAGVRNLERVLGKVARKAATEFARTKAPVIIDAARTREYLKSPPVRPEEMARSDMVGVATGVYYSPVGGDIMFVEASVMTGKGALTLTGQLGDVMQESARAALTYARSNSLALGIRGDVGVFDLHVHVPAGAVPKDGPSAGITMATAIVSALSGRPVRRDVAMTGEVTLHGRVLPIGGLKEKALGAHRAGIRELIVPKANEGDLEEIPAEITGEMRFHLVEDLSEVFSIALARPQMEPLLTPGGQSRPAAPAH